MKNRKVGIVLIGVMMLSLVGCNSTSSSGEVSTASEGTLTLEENTSEPVAEIPEGAGNEESVAKGEVTAIGKVTSVAGNMVTIQIGSFNGSTGGAAGMQGGRPEGTEKGEMPEGGRPEGAEKGEISEGERPEGIEGREMPEGERPEGMEGQKMQEGMDRGGMSESGLEAIDMSEVIELTEKTMEIMIPVGTPVYSSTGVTYDFTDIVEDCYLTVSEDEAGTIVAINVLG